MIALALGIGVLVGAGVFMVLRRGLMRVIVGFVLLSHGVNLLLVAAGGVDRRGAATGAGADPAITADPLPQAFVLTAIVIAFAITVFLLGLSITGEGDDDTHIELEGRELETPNLIDPTEEYESRLSLPREPGGPPPTPPPTQVGRGGHPR
ncbi:MAG: cation:proton antiporter subunit C [Propionibacteriaceae bacterium]|nr:cation:proton antiporter subunit C [Propionibacteriaceae bacterium]